MLYILRLKIKLQYDCLIRMTGYRGTVLQSVVETYFDYGGLRIEMISQLIDIDINLRKLKLQQERQCNDPKFREEQGTICDEKLCQGTETSD